MKVLFFALIISVVGVVRPAYADDDADERAAAAVFRSMHDDLERCFQTSRANAFVLIEALIDDAGRVRTVSATGDGRASALTRRCLEERVARARFPTSRGGGTSRVRTSFVFSWD